MGQQMLVAHCYRQWHKIAKEVPAGFQCRSELRGWQMSAARRMSVFGGAGFTSVSNPVDSFLVGFW